MHLTFSEHLSTVQQQDILAGSCGFYRNSFGPNKKMCVSGYKLPKIRVDRSDYFFIF